MLVVTTVGAPLYQSCSSKRKLVFLFGRWQLQEAFAFCRRHAATCPPTRERRGHNPVDGVAVGFGRPSQLQTTSLTALRVLW
jgi:hypothetical protein